VNNETGVVQPVAEVTKLAHEHGALVLCDAVQAVAKIPVDFCELDVDLMSLSAHKIGGPEGIGALVVKDDLPLASWHRGGGQEKGRRAGTENVPGIVGFGAAAEELDRHLNDMPRIRDLRDRLERAILAIAPDTEIFGANVERLPNTSYFAVPGMSSETQIMALDLAGISVSAGSACSSGTVRPSHVLKAMGQSDAHASAAIRVSFGWNSKNSDVDKFISAWSVLYARLISKTEAHSA
jgi:cysteine desulfurase